MRMLLELDILLAKQDCLNFANDHLHLILHVQSALCSMNQICRSLHNRKSTLKPVLVL